MRYLLTCPQVYLSAGSVVRVRVRPMVMVRVGVGVRVRLVLPSLATCMLTI